MRVAILLAKAAWPAFELAEQVAYFVAKHIRSNVRELEGALGRIIHLLELPRAAIDDRPVAKEALRDLLAVHNRGQISIRADARRGRRLLQHPIADMGSELAPVRRRSAATDRDDAGEGTDPDCALPEIGSDFGGRDHHRAARLPQDRQAARHHPELNHKIHVPEQTLREYL